MRRVLLITMLLILLSAVPEYGANPGGEGSGTEEFACGGACHGDPGLSGDSSAQLTMTTDSSDTYVGGSIAVTVSAQDMELSSRKLAGLFLLTGTHGVGDTPQDSGWIFLSDGAGGSGNYVEKRVTSSDNAVSATWALRAPAIEGEYRLIAAIHHGGDGTARMAVDEVGVVISVGPVPENLPQISADWTPPAVAIIGQQVSLSVPAVNSTSVHLEWNSRGASGTVAMTEQSGQWQAQLPTALSATEIQYRVVMSNENFEETSAWITLSVEPPEVLPDVWAFRLQSMAILFVSLALCITLNRRFSRTSSGGKIGAPSTFDKLVTLPLEQAQHAVAGVDLADPRRPYGWSDEQWIHYGEEYLKDQGGGA